MENKVQDIQSGLGVPPLQGIALGGSPVVPQEPAVAPQPSIQQQPAVNQQITPPPRRSFKLSRKVILIAILVLIMITGVTIALFIRPEQPSQPVGNRFNTVEIPLEDFRNLGNLELIGTRSLSINGPLQANGTFVISPSAQPSTAAPGQIYYDQATNQLMYFNGTSFVGLNSLETGVGLANADGVLSNAGVLSIQGLVGEITLGSGLGATGNILQNNGVLNINAGNGISIANNGGGNFTVTNTGSGTGTVTSSGGTVGRIPVFTGVQNIEDSLISQSGLTVTVNGDLSVVTGGLSLTNALTVSNGGTGATSFAANGVLIGNGTSPITAVTAGGPNLCFTSTAGAPIFAACPGAAGVTTLNGLSGALNIANASGAGSTVTIDNASTGAKGIAQFNGTNFTDNGAGTINTIQNINTAASPQFTNLILTGDLAIQGGTATLGTASQAGNLAIHDGSGFTGNILLDVLGQNTAYSLPDPGTATAEICLNSGNCAGAGGGIVGSGTINRLSKFTAGGAIGDSSISDDGASVTASTNMVIQGGNLTVGTSSQLASMVLHDGGGETTTLQAGNSSSNLTFILPTGAGTSFQCLKKGPGNQLIWDNCEGGGGGGGGVTSLNTLLGDLTVQGTANQILVSDNGTNTITLATPQNIATSSSPTFANMTLSGDLAVNGGDITSTGPLTISPTGALNVTSNLNLTAGSQYQINGLQISSADLSNDSNLAKLNASQTFTGNNNSFRNGSNSTNAFNVQNAAGVRVLTVDTSTGQLELGVGASLDGRLVFNAISNNTVTILPGAPSANRTITLPDANGIICLDSGNCPGSGANTALSNLSGVAINTSLLPGVAGAINLGSGTLPFGDLFLAGTSGTPETNNFRITGASTGGTRVITLPDESGTVCTNAAGSTACQGSFILNQSASNQTANFQISGTGRANTSILTPLVDVASAGTLSLGTGTANAITIGNTTANSPVSINSGTGIISIGTGGQARTINLGTGAAVVQTINIGGTGANIIAVGNTQTAGSVNLGAAMTSGTINIGGTGNHTGSIEIGSGTGTQTINIGNNSSGSKTVRIGPAGGSVAATIDIASGIGANSVNINNNSNTGTTTIGSGQARITLSAGGSTIAVGSNAVAQGVFVGNTTVGSSTNIRGGSAFNAINLATGSNFVGTAGGIIIGNTTGTDTQAIDLGTNATASSTTNVTIGSTVAGTTAIQGATTITNRTGGSANTLIVSNSTSTGNIALFRDNATAVLTIADGGGIEAQNQTNSAAAFRILNSSGGGSVPQFVVDTSNSRVYIGNPTADGTGALLVLDSKNTAGDPTGVLGGMYYNSSRGKMRCFELDQGTTGYWRDCIESSRTGVRYRTEMFHTSTDNYFEFFVENSGTIGDIAGEAGHPGIVRSSTDASTTGNAGFAINSTNDNWLLLGNSSVWRYDTVARIPTLSIAGEPFTVRTGFQDNFQGDSVDGCYFRYSHSINGGEWQGVCADNSTTTTCDTNIAVAAGTWYRLTIVVNAGGTSADFQVNGTSACQVASNIPDTAGRETNVIGTIKKDSLGTTATTFDQDYAEFTSDMPPR